MLTVISPGAGWQATTLALLAVRGILTPMPDLAIFADTGEEPRAVYEHLVRLCGMSVKPHPDDARRLVALTGRYQAGVLPFPVEVAAAWAPGGTGKALAQGPLGDQIIKATRHESGFHSRPPFFVIANGKKGMIRRQCTGDYKIDVITAVVRRALGLRFRQRWPKEIRVEQWIGISTDEATRMKPFMMRPRRKGDTPRPHPTLRARWPLAMELGMSRADCGRWLQEHWVKLYGNPMPPKSACTFCPFHENARWRDLRDNDPGGWARAIEIDAAIRKGLTSKALTGEMYVHRSCKPLADVDLSAHTEDQLNLFENECEGMCG